MYTRTRIRFDVNDGDGKGRREGVKGGRVKRRRARGEGACTYRPMPTSSLLQPSVWANYGHADPMDGQHANPVDRMLTSHANQRAQTARSQRGQTLRPHAPHARLHMSTCCVLDVLSSPS